MEAKLKLALNQAPWSLAVRSGATALLWLIIPFWLWLPFGLGAVLASRKDPKYAFGGLIMVWLFLALAGGLVIEEAAYYLMAVEVAVLAGLIIGLREIWFTERLVGVRIFSNLANLSVWPLFFYLAGAEGSLMWWLVLVAAVTYWLNNEVVKMALGGEGGMVPMMTWLMTLVTIEVIWGVWLLPIGYLFQAVSVIIFTIAMQEFILSRTKRISHDKTLWLITISILLWLLVLGLAKWSL